MACVCLSCRALRNELSPPEWVEDTERASGNILGALFTFPRPYEFQFVIKPSASRGKDDLVASVRSTVCSVCQVDEGTAKFECRERLGGKYVSISCEVVVRAPEIVNIVYEKLESDPHVVMKF